MNTTSVPTHPPSISSEPTPHSQPGHWALLITGVLLTVVGVILTAVGVALPLQDAATWEPPEFLTDHWRTLLTGGLTTMVLGVLAVLWAAAALGAGVKPGPRGAPTTYPLCLRGVKDERLSRGLWLVKWILVAPHYVVLALLWIAVAVVTPAAWVTILVTGRYPRGLFAFTVGVLRWSWRVGFYAYAAIGTDRYPPFSLAADPAYPADLAVPYPRRLSRGLVLVKSWLLAIPHLLIVSVIAGGAEVVWRTGVGAQAQTGGARAAFSLLGLLVLVAGVLLLVTGTYRDGLFNLVMGLNRWTYRVSAYVLLLRDEYPPFRLDQGPTEPTDRDGVGRYRPPFPPTDGAALQDRPPARQG